MRRSLGLTRCVDEREADECRLDPRVRKWSLGVTEVWERLRGWRSLRGTKIPWGSCGEERVEQECTAVRDFPV